MQPYNLPHFLTVKRKIMADFYEENKRAQEILDDMLKCNAFCVDLGRVDNTVKRKGYSLVEYYLKVLPGIEYVKQQLVNYMFSNGLTTGKKADDDILDAFLYKNNRQGVTNYDVLRNAIGTASVWGECGVRRYKGDIYYVAPGTYGALVDKVDGILDTVAYFVAKDGKPLNKDVIDLEELFDYGEEERMIPLVRERFEEQGVLLLDKSEFINIRNDTTELHGSCPLLKDTLRLDLLVTTYEQLIDDLKYDGPGRIVLHPKSGFYGSENNEISTGEMLNQTMNAIEKRAESVRSEAAKVAEQLKHSGSDAAIVLSEKFDKQIDKLPRVTKATEFLDWINQEGEILAQDIGMEPALIGLGDVSGNVSMEKIIDNSMLNTIIPRREFYATQFSPLISYMLGIEKVYFDKYEMAQTEDVNTMRTKIVNMMSILNSIQREDTDRLVGELADMFSENIHYDTGELRELAVGKMDTKGANNEQNK